MAVLVAWPWGGVKGDFIGASTWGAEGTTGSYGPRSQNWESFCLHYG